MIKKDIKNFIKSAIKQRKMIVRKKRNRKDNILIQKYIKFLESYTPGLNTTPRAVKFFITHFNKVSLLLPPDRASEAQEMLDICKSINCTNI